MKTPRLGCERPAGEHDKLKFAALQCCSQSIMPRNDKLYDFLGTYHGSMAIACMLL